MLKLHTHADSWVSRNNLKDIGRALYRENKMFNSKGILNARFKCHISETVLDYIKSCLMNLPKIGPAGDSVVAVYMGYANNKGIEIIKQNI